jgi:hypothetical protein
MINKLKGCRLFPGLIQKLRRRKKKKKEMVVGIKPTLEIASPHHERNIENIQTLTRNIIFYGR